MIYIDSSAMMYLLYDIKPMSTIVLQYLTSGDKLFMSLKSIEEITYAVIRIEANRTYGVKGAYSIRRIISRYGLDFAREKLELLRKLIEDAGIEVLHDTADIHELHDVMFRYNLLPGDAVIALTCKHYGIDTILTFDEDFKRVPWLRVVP